MGLSICLTLVLLIFRFLKRSRTNSIPKENPYLLSSFQWLVRHIYGAYHLGLWAFTWPQFYGRKFFLLFLTTRSCLLHRKTPRHWVFSVFWTHWFYIFLYVCYSSYVMDAALLLMFWSFSPFIGSYSYQFVTHEGNTFKQASLTFSVAGIREARC